MIHSHGQETTFLFVAHDRVVQLCHYKSQKEAKHLYLGMVHLSSLGVGAMDATHSTESKHLLCYVYLGVIALFEYMKSFLLSSKSGLKRQHVPSSFISELWLLVKIYGNPPILLWLGIIQ